MDDKRESNKNYEILDGDDVLLFDKATFLVRSFEELVTSKFIEVLDIIAIRESRHKSIIDCLKELRINEEIIIKGGEIDWNSPQEGIDCQVLKIGSKGWQKGRLQIKVKENLQSGETQVCIKFCPDEPPEQKSPLDDIRQSEEYKKLSNNN
ncbi:KGK domain-containing protein [Microcoleus sp. Pol17_C1]|uniref:KGK domain-containing protein n=1 Tax=unclassified Microcoleus TaxID=2642155 RepID=UPI002FD1338B